MVNIHNIEGFKLVSNSTITIYNQMWLIVFTDNCHFTNIVKKKRPLYLIILRKVKTCNSSKKWIYYIMKIIFLKFRIHIKFTKLHKSI